MKTLMNAAVLGTAILSISVVLAYWEQTVAVSGQIVCNVVPADENPMKVVVVDRFTKGPQRNLAQTSVNETGHFFVKAIARKVLTITAAIEVYHSCYWGPAQVCSVFLVDNKSLPCVTRGTRQRYTVCNFKIELDNTTLLACANDEDLYLFA